MKKFLTYSFGITILAIIFGVLSVYGFFDVSDGQANLIGSSRTINTGVGIHNHIVDVVGEIGVDARDLNNFFISFETTSDVTILTEKVDSLLQKKTILKGCMQRAEFRHNKEKIENVFYQKYLPALKSYCNSFKRVLQYSATKPFDDRSLNSFKQTSVKFFNQYQNAHNLLVEELNRARRY